MTNPCRSGKRCPITYPWSLDLRFVAMRHLVTVSHIGWALHKPDNHTANGDRQRCRPDENHQPDHDKVKGLNLMFYLGCRALIEQSPTQPCQPSRQHSSCEQHTGHHAQQTQFKSVRCALKTRKFFKPIHRHILSTISEKQGLRGFANTGGCSAQIYAVKATSA